MKTAIDRTSLEFCAALGACGLEIVLDQPFRPFVIIFGDRYAQDNANQRIAYEILDPRAIELIQEEEGLHYSIRLAPNPMKGAKDRYRSHLICKVAIGSLGIEKASSSSIETWYIRKVINDSC